MVSLLQNSLDMLPLQLPTAGESVGGTEGILSSIAHILFLALDNCKILFFLSFFFIFLIFACM